MITSLSELLDSVNEWIQESIPHDRLKNDSEGRAWALSRLHHYDTLKVEDLSNFTNRDELNNEYVRRYKETDAKSRKGISALKLEISALYSFNKCFVQRYKGRMHYYRDDLSQKGIRNMYTVGQSFALFEEFKKNLD
jgi:hypothetical protein